MVTVYTTMTDNHQLPHSQDLALILLDSNPMNDFNASHKELFNFSLSEAYDILFENRNENRILSPKAEVVLISIYSVLVVVGLMANILVCYVVARKCQRRSSRNLYIVNLTISDLTLCIICMPFTLISLFKRNWTLGSFLCKLVPVVQGTNIMVSTATIIAIALDRYWSITRVCRDASSKVQVCWSIVIIWFLSFLYTFPLFFYQGVEKVQLRDIVLYETCIEKWPYNLKPVYTLGIIVVQCIIPIAVLSTVHGKITSYLNVHVSSHRESKRAQRDIKRNKNTTILLSCIAVVFSVSWLPLNIFTLVADISPHFTTAENQYSVFAVCHIIAMTSSFTNPVLYGLLNTNFRREFLDLMPQRCRPPCSASMTLDPTVERPKTTQVEPQECITLLVFQSKQVSNNIESTTAPNAHNL